MKIWNKVDPYFFVAYFISYLLLFVLLGDVVRAVNNCEGEPTVDRYIRHGSGVGDCYLWGPIETDYECCLLCKQEFDVSLVASRILRPGGWDPFGSETVNGIKCCCYAGGEVQHGTDRTYYYFE